MADAALEVEKTTTKKQEKKALTPKERFENRQAAKKRAVENNVNAIVFEPESPIIQGLMREVRTFDSLDALMRAEVGAGINADDFFKHLDSLKQVTVKLKEVNENNLQAIANSNVRLFAIRNYDTRTTIEKMRKSKQEPVSAQKEAGVTTEIEESSTTKKK